MRPEAQKICNITKSIYMLEIIYIHIYKTLVKFVQHPLIIRRYGDRT